MKWWIWDHNDVRDSYAERTGQNPAMPIAIIGPIYGMNHLIVEGDTLIDPEHPGVALFVQCMDMLRKGKTHSCKLVGCIEHVDLKTLSGPPCFVHRIQRKDGSVHAIEERS